MKKTIVIICSTMLYIATFAQEESYPDTVKVNINDKAIVEVISADYSKIHKSEKIDSILTLFQEEFKKIKNQLPENEYYKIEYTPDKPIEFERIEEKKKYIVVDDSLKEYHPGHVVKIILKDCIVRIHSYDLESLKQLDLQQCTNEALAKLPKRDKTPSVLNYQCKGGEVKALKDLDMHYPVEDQLMLRAGIGVEVLRNKLLTDASYEIGVFFNRKQKYSHYWYGSYNVYVLWDEVEDKIYRDGFANIGHRVVSNKKKLSPYGFEVGIPIAHNNKIFKHNDFRVGFSWGISNTLLLNGYIYISDDDYTYPSIGLRYFF